MRPRIKLSAISAFATLALTGVAPGQTLPTAGVIVFENNEPLQAIQIMRLDLASGQLLIEAEGEDPFATGEEVVFISRCGEYSLDAALSISDADGFVQTVPEVCDPDATTGRLFAPILNPSGDVIAVSDPMIPDEDSFLGITGTDGIRVYARDGSELAAHQGYAFPVFDSQGRLYAAATGEVADIPFGIYRFDESYASPERIDDGRLNGPVRSTRLHPDGDKIGFIFNGAIFQMPLDTGAPERIVRTAVQIAWMDFAPDGSGIVYVSTDPLDEALQHSIDGYPLHFVGADGDASYPLPFIPGGPINWLAE